MKYRNPLLENTNEAPEYEAQRVLTEIGWDGVPPVDLMEICEMYGFEYFFEPKPLMKEEGTTKFRGEGDFFILINTHNSDCKDGFSNNQTLRRRQRFTMAHELAHCTYKSHTNLALQKNLAHRENPYSKPYTKLRESQANEFAAHLLVPRKAFKEISHRVGWNNPKQIIEETSETFDVSLQVAAQQVAQFADFPCIAIVFNPDGLPKRIPSYSPYFQETELFYSRHQSVPEGTSARKLMNSINAGSVSTQVFQSASTWFPEVHEAKTEKFSVTETSFKLGPYGILSFLEIEDTNS